MTHKPYFKYAYLLYGLIASGFATISMFTDWFERFSLDKFFAIQGTFMGVGISLCVAWSVWRYLIRGMIKDFKK